MLGCRYNTKLKLLDHVVSGACVLTVGVFESDILIINLWHYFVFCIRSGVTRCSLIMVLYLYFMCQYGFCVVLWSHSGILIHLLGRTSQYCRISIPLSVLLWKDLSAPVFDGVGLVGFKSKTNYFLWVKAACSLFIFYCFPFLFFFL